MIYLDNNATTKPLPEATAGVLRVLAEHWENPSSVHRGGQGARQEVDLARRSVARLLGCTPRELVFTSGATESIDAAFRGVLAANARKSVIVTTAVEHEAVRDLCKSLEEESAGRITTRLLPLGDGGIADPNALDALLDDSVALVSVQWANNETGAIHPIAEIGAACRARGIPFHTDATQWIGKMPCDVAAMPIDLLSFSGHKFHGIKGAGGLFIRRGVRLRPVLRGTQEMERRGGTENVPGIVAMAAAAQAAQAWLADDAERERLAHLRDRFEADVLTGVSDASINGPRDARLRLWNTTNIAFPRLQAEALLLLLSERGVYASAGAACSSGSLDPSPVLLAMGIPPERAHGSLRFSLSRFTTEQELAEAAGIIADCVRRLRQSATSVHGR
jgi:cysteine desulfurase